MKTFTLGPTLTCNLDILIASRLLLTASSGQGKTRTVRRLLEQTHGMVQHLVIDPEGEYSTLREKFDYVLASPKGGDVIAHPKYAAALAEELLKLQASAILDIYELNPSDRKLFVKNFVMALVDSPRESWHPCLVVIDEIHNYCPERGEAVSAEAIEALSTRGRKRGFCLIAATQRIAKFKKDAAAELANKLVGGCNLDLDVDRAGEDLGFAKADRAKNLRGVEPGIFWAFGRAFNALEPKKVKIGNVVTTHPEPGQAAPPTVPATAKVRAVLEKLSRLPKEAEQKQQTLETALHDLATANRELGRLKAQGPIQPTERVEIKVPVIPDGLIANINEMRGSLDGLSDLLTGIDNLTREARRSAGDGQAAARRAVAMCETAQRVVQAGKPIHVQLNPLIHPPRVTDGGVSGVEQRILNALAELEQLGAKAPAKELVALLAGYTHLNSKGFTNGLGAVRSAGLVSGLSLTEAGRQHADWSRTPQTPAEVQARVVALLGGATGRILDPLLKIYPQAMPKPDVAAQAGYGHLNSKGFTNAVGKLRTLGFVEYPSKGMVKASPVLFLEA